MAINYFEELKESLEQAAAYAKGDASRVRVTVREIPTPSYTSTDIANIRKNAGLSQRALATALGVSPRTVEAWEAGKNSPAGSSVKLLYLIEKDNNIVSQLVAVV